ncbi:galactoside 2-alpha-L-fucosyltransferase-like [Ananas comosus]|uniref:Fucosyltransferase n=1 Tax=Ananas comosus TaxID=4615 RepID=A0A6P5FCM9_ANACO|nr:galactoside 2-alpha-L-fucosyltransferase-like [Ananas comosus]
MDSEKSSRMQQPHADSEMDAAAPRLTRFEKKGWDVAAVRPAVVLVATMLAVLLLVTLVSRPRWTASQVCVPGLTMRSVRAGTDNALLLVYGKGAGEASFVTVAEPNDKLLGGLLSHDFDEQSCLSRYQSILYRNPSHHILSSYLISKLRKYEALHKKCGPGTPLFRKSLEQLKHNHSAELECNYALWTPNGGLGNRMLSIASVFLYALLNNKVLLIHETDDLVDIFCEPFPGTSWVIPKDFPIKDLQNFHRGNQQSYGEMLGKHSISNNATIPMESLPPFVYAHLRYDYTHLDRLFYCSDDQSVLRKVNWVLIRTDNYFVPALFMIPEYEDELRRMFPNGETVFHHLGRYLFHPSNTVWGMIIRYHESYLAKAKERVGVQIRIFSWAPIPSDGLFDQIIRCAQDKNILPAINPKETESPSLEEPTESKAILVASLHYEYYEKMKKMYYEHSTVTGETVGVYQPTHEGQQQTEKQSHNQKALAEIWLLSFSDVLITTAASTFGYVSSDLAGLKPWVLSAPENRKAPDIACRRAFTLEPCFHSPPNFDCRAKRNADTGNLVRHVTHCVDWKKGVTLIE